MHLRLLENQRVYIEVNTDREIKIRDGEKRDSERLQRQTGVEFETDKQDVGSASFMPRFCGR